MNKIIEKEEEEFNLLINNFNSTILMKNKKIRNNFTEKLKIFYDLLKPNQLNNILIMIHKRLNNTKDIYERVFFLLSINSIIIKLNRNKLIEFIDKLINDVYNVCFYSNDKNFIIISIQTLNSLLSIPNINLIQQIEEIAIYCINKILKNESLMNSIFLLIELLRYSQFLILKNIMKQKYTKFFKNIFKYKSIEVKQKGLSLLGDIIDEIVKRENMEQKTILTNIYQELKLELLKKNIKEDIVIFIKIIKFFLNISNRDVFQHKYKEIIEFIIEQYQNNKFIYEIKEEVLLLLPYLINFNPDNFYEKGYFKMFFNFLKENLEKNLFIEKSLDGITHLIFPFKPEIILDDLVSIFYILYKLLKIFDKKIIDSYVNCIDKITNKLGNKYFNKIKKEYLWEIVDSLIINGFNYSFIKYLEKISNSNYISHNKDKNILQIKILYKISYTLTMEFYRFTVSDIIDNIEMILYSFKNSIKANYQTIQINDIISSLRCLIEFKFPDYEMQLANFIVDIVTKLLEHENSVIRILSAKTVSLISSHNHHNDSLSFNLMSEIIHKVLNLALIDPNNSVRIEMLKALNCNFNLYLNNEVALKKLFLCLNDSYFEIGEESLWIIKRMIPFNASLIIPCLQKNFCKVLLSITIDFDFKENLLLKRFKKLIIYLKHIPFLITNYIKMIIEFLIEKIDSIQYKNTIISEILNTLSHLVNIDRSISKNYYNHLINISLKYMQNNNSEDIRISSIILLSNTIIETGYGLLINLHFNSIMEDIFNRIINENSEKVKIYWMKLIGSIGAIDPFLLKKIQKLYHNNNVNENEVIDYIKKIQKNNLIFKKEYTTKIKNNYKINKEKMNKFVKNVYNLNQIILKQKNIFFSPDLTEDKYFSNFYNNQDDYNNDLHLKNDEHLELILNMNSKIKLNNLENLLNYISENVILTLIKHLFDPEILNQHIFILNSWYNIIYALRYDIYNYLKIIVYPLIFYFKNTEKLESKKKILNLFENLILSTEHKFLEHDQDNINHFINLLEKQVYNVNYMFSCWEIIEQLITYCKKCLFYKLDNIFIIIIQILLEYKSNEKIMQKIFMILKKNKYINDAFLYLIIPAFCKLLIEEELNLSFKIHAIRYLSILIKSPSSTQYCGTIIRTLLELVSLKNTKDYAKHALYELIFTYKSKILVYFPIIHTNFIKNKLVNEVQYQKIIDYLQNNGDLENIENPYENNEQSEKSFENDKTNFEKNKPRLPVKSFKSESLKLLFEANNIYQKENWEEWFKKILNELINKTPSEVLFCVKEYASINYNFSKELFNCSFAICWSQLNDTQKNYIIRNLEKIINYDKVPLNVLNEILNLSLFMEHENIGLQINIDKMSLLAEKCNSLSKSIYYREIQFMYDPENSFEKLIMLYSHLSQEESAYGILEFAKNQNYKNINKICYESIKKWDFILKDKNNTNDKSLINKESTIRCYEAICDWDNLLKECENYEKEENYNLNFLSKHASKAIVGLGEWDKLDNYISNIKEKEHMIFYESISLIKKENFSLAKEKINILRKWMIDNFLEFNISSYQNNYENILTLQKLNELEEIININSKIKNNENELNLYIDSNENKINMFNEYKNNLLTIWNDRLTIIERNPKYWIELLSLRELAFTKKDMIKSWTRVIKFCIKEYEFDLAKRIIDDIKNKLKHDYPKELKLYKYECKYLLKELEYEKLVKKFKIYFNNNKNISFELQGYYYCKLGKFLLEHENIDNDSDYNEVINLLDTSLKFNKEGSKVWHFYGLANFKQIMKYYNSSFNSVQSEDKIKIKKLCENKDKLYVYIKNCIKGFVKALSIGDNLFAESQQDVLRVLNIWFNFSCINEFQEIISKEIENIPVKRWLNVIPQIIARLDVKNKNVSQNITNLLIKISDFYPQEIIFHLILCWNSKNKIRKKLANEIISKMKLKHPKLIEESIIINSELNRTSIIFEEEWYDFLDEAYQYYSNENYDIMIKYLLKLHKKVEKNQQTENEISFYLNYSNKLNEAKDYIILYQNSKNIFFWVQAWKLYYEVHTLIENKVKNMKFLYLKNISPELLNMQNSVVAIPGIYNSVNQVYIKGFSSILHILKSKRRPRKVSIKGSDGKNYNYLLKGNEDLRQDQRVMQLLNLMNNLLKKDRETENKDLDIITFPVIPLSPNTGILGWVENCDTLQELIVEYRENNNIDTQIEYNLVFKYFPKFDILPILKKLEVYDFVVENIKGEDLKRVLWQKSINAEEWIERRSNYMRSWAVMSCVGYILGLGDRHLSNLMLQRQSGKIVHIDFGDCFEVTMNREKFPEKVPFRLTRILTNAMEPSGIEGKFRLTFESILKVVRKNKESIMAIIEAFVNDPLLNWRLLNTNELNNTESKFNNEKITSLKYDNNRILSMNNKSVVFKMIDNENDNNENKNVIIIKKAYEAIEKLKKKLNGKEFHNSKPLSIKEQTNLLIKQAINPELICQSFIGWNPFL